MNTKHYNKSEELNPLEWFWIPTGKKGSKACHWVHYTQIPIFKTILDKQTLYKNQNIAAVGEINKVLELFEKRPATNIVNGIYMMCQILIQSKLLLDDKDFVAVQSTDSYITGKANVDDVFSKEYVDQFTNLLNGCHQVVDGVIVEDNVKLQEMEEN